MKIGNLRKTGIKVIGDVPWGSHICQFYETKKDLLDIVVPYFKAGLENNEYCIWIINENLSIPEAKAALQKGIPEFDTYLKCDCIEIFLYADWYFQHGKFELGYAIKSIFDRLRIAEKRNFDGLRLHGSGGWFDRKEWKSLVDYETTLNKVLDSKHLVIGCTYDLKKADAGDVLDIAAMHESAVARRKGHWEILEVPTLRKTKEQITKEKKALEMRVVERTKALSKINRQLNHLKEALQESEEYLNFAVATAGFATWDLNLKTNQILTKMELGLPGFPKSGEEWKIKRYQDLVLPEDRHIFEEAIKDAQQSGKLEMKVRIQLDDGSIHWLEETGKLLTDDEGNPAHIIGTIKDITDHEELERRKDDLISTISHELKTPVTSIKALTQILEKKFSESNDELTHGMIKKMSIQLNRLTSLIRNLLEANRIQFGKMELYKSDFLFYDLIDDAVNEIKKRTTSHTIEIAGKKSIACHSDKERLNQVLTNLLTNAIKFSPKKENVKIWAKPNKSKKEVTCCIQDFGIGIPKAKQKHIFDRFYRVIEEHNYAFQGIGLGLYISSEIVKRLGGKIWVTSTGDKGSTFCFSIPSI